MEAWRRTPGETGTAMRMGAPELVALNAGKDRLQVGASLLEALVALAIMGILLAVGLARMDLGSPGLGAVQGELRGALEQALLQARAQGREQRVALQAGPDGRTVLTEPGALRPLLLPRGVHWGLPAGGVPLPPGMAQPVRAHLTGQAHAAVTVTPQSTAMASVWFLHDGQDALCLRLSDHGHLQLLRWRHHLRQWTRV